MSVVTTIEGQTIVFPSGFPAVDTEHVVKGGCASPEGQWACVTHKLVFMSNLQAGSHEREGGDHVVVWLCNEHGPEVP